MTYFMSFSVLVSFARKCVNVLFTVISLLEKYFCMSIFYVKISFLIFSNVYNIFVIFIIILLKMCNFCKRIKNLGCDFQHLPKSRKHIFLAFFYIKSCLPELSRDNKIT